MTPEQIKLISEILGVFVLLVSIASLNCKSMSLLVIFQCAANVFVVCQYAIRGEISSSGVCAVGAVETLIIYLLSRKGKKLPVCLTVVFTAIALAFPVASVLMENREFNFVSDLFPMIAAVLFNIAMVQSRSSVSRVLMFMNAFLWLLLNIVNPSVSLIITYVVLEVFNVVGIVRLDRADWRAFFSRIFGKGENKELYSEISEKTEENL